jgi:hypothetical protein
MGEEESQDSGSKGHAPFASARGPVDPPLTTLIKTRYIISKKEGSILQLNHTFPESTFRCRSFYHFFKFIVFAVYLDPQSIYFYM